MGRLTLNVLLSSAQFEREVTAERIRDKIRASKAKGKWMGGVVPVGYRVEDRKLLPVPEEAALVRRIFERYLALGSVSRLKTELDRDDICTPARQHWHGGSRGGALFSRGRLYALLVNPVFIGKIRHGDLIHVGRHQAIVDDDLWRAVQQKLKANSNLRLRNRLAGSATVSPLAGKLTDPDGNPMRASHAKKANGTRYRYYVSRDLVERSVKGGAKGWRIPALELEAAVGHAPANRLRDPASQSGFLADATSTPVRSRWLLKQMEQMAGALDAPGSDRGRKILAAMIGHVHISEIELRAEARFTDAALSERDDATASRLTAIPSFSFSTAILLQRRGPELRLVLQGAPAPERRPDASLIRHLVESRRRCSDYLDPHHDLTVSAIAARDGLDAGAVSRSMQLGFLAPPIVAHILDGTQPVALTAERLKRNGELPLLWQDQAALIT